jgi:hypothetical protein
MVAEKITKYHEHLLLIGPVAEPMMCPIVTNGRITELYNWQNFCNQNGFYDGDTTRKHTFSVQI